jgi:transcriptional regulator with XRE-family HTH domain
MFDRYRVVIFHAYRRAVEVPMPQRKKHRASQALKKWRGADSQTAAAKKFHISQAEYCRIEQGLRIPKPKLALRMAEKTGVPLERLLG